MYAKYSPLKAAAVALAMTTVTGVSVTKASVSPSEINSLRVQSIPGLAAEPAFKDLIHEVNNGGLQPPFMESISKTLRFEYSFGKDPVGIQINNEGNPSVYPIPETPASKPPGASSQNGGPTQ